MVGIGEILLIIFRLIFFTNINFLLTFADVKRILSRNQILLNLLKQ